MDLPVFRYHPDPIGTGSVEPSDAPCRSCGIGGAVGVFWLFDRLDLVPDDSDPPTTLSLK